VGVGFVSTTGAWVAKIFGTGAGVLGLLEEEVDGTGSMEPWY
jgi:hypothetical protein